MRRLFEIVWIVTAIAVAAAVHSLWMGLVQIRLDAAFGIAVLAQSPEPYPPPVAWGYQESAWIPLSLMVSCLIFCALFFVLRRLKLSDLLSVWISVFAFIISVTSRIPPSHYYAWKRNIVSISLLVLAVLLWNARSRWKEALYWLKVPGNARRVAFGLILLSVFQRIIEMKMGVQLLAAADDPLSYHKHAVALIERGEWPPRSGSPGLPFFLAGLYGVFGISAIFPKLALILASAASLYVLYSLVVRRYGGPLAGLVAILSFNLSSQYVAFSNHLWNENVFVLLLPFFLYAAHEIFQPGERIWWRVLLWSITTGMLVFMMTLFRSWIPVFIVALIFAGVSDYCSRERAFLTVLGVGCAITVFVMSIILFSTVQSHFLKEPGYVTSNFYLIFAQGNNPYSHGGFTNHFRTYAVDAGIKEDDFKAISYEILKYSIEHPSHLPAMFAKKALLWFWGAANPKYFPGYYIAPGTLAAYYWRMIWFAVSVLGFVRLWKDSKRMPAMLYFLMTSVFVVLMVEHRFLIQALPLQAIAVGSYLASFLDRIHNRMEKMSKVAVATLQT